MSSIREYREQLSGDQLQVMKEVFQAINKGDVCPTLEQVKDWIDRFPDMAKQWDPENYNDNAIESDDDDEWSDEEEDDGAIEVPKYYTAPLHAILNRFPESVPIETLQLLVDAWPESLKLGDDNDCCPLQRALCAESPFEIIKFLADQYPEAIKRKGSCYGCDPPIEMVLWGYPPRYDVLEYFCSQWTKQSFSKNPNKNWLQNGLKRYGYTWENRKPSLEYLQLLVKYLPELLDPSYIDRGRSSMLQIALSNTPEADADGKWRGIVEWLVAIRPSDVMKCEEDSSRYPLHIFLDALSNSKMIPHLNESHLSVLGLLRKVGPEVFAMPSNRTTWFLPLDYARKHPRSTILPYLVDPEDATALHYYLRNGGRRDKTVEWLLEENLGVLSQSDAEGNLPLHLALQRSPCRRVTIEVYKLILGLCPEAVTMPNQKGQLPLHIAAKNSQHPKVIEELAKTRPEAVGQKDTYGWLPFLLAAQNQNGKFWHEGTEADVALEMVYYLLRLAPATLQN